MVVLYDYDLNAIVFKPIKTRQSKEILRAFLKCEQKIASNNTTLCTFILDNEASRDLQESLTKNNTAYELVPPNMHRWNAAEKSICTFKITF